MDNSTLNNPGDNAEDPPPPPAPMQVFDSFQPFHYANGSDEGEEAVPAPVANASSAMRARASELTISFEGEVYVFPAVTPEKVPLLFYYISKFRILFTEKNMFFQIVFFNWKNYFFFSIVIEAWHGVDFVSCLTDQFEEVFEFSVLNRLREKEKKKPVSDRDFFVSSCVGIR